MSEDRRSSRGETPEERADRNWLELLQELRVSQTGVQLLAGFLATVGVTLAPVAIHRHVFQENAKPELVRAGHRLTSIALALIAVLLGGILFLVVDVVYDRQAAAAGAVASVVVLAGLLLVLPSRLLRRS